MEDSVVYSSDQISCEFYEDPLVVEVNMKDSTPPFDDEQEQRLETITPTNQALKLENIHLKLDNRELQRELANCKQRLAFLEKHVHNLSRVTGSCDCFCFSCTNSTDVS